MELRGSQPTIITRIIPNGDIGTSGGWYAMSYQTNRLSAGGDQSSVAYIQAVKAVAAGTYGPGAIVTEVSVMYLRVQLFPRLSLYIRCLN